MQLALHARQAAHSRAAAARAAERSRAGMAVPVSGTSGAAGLMARTRSLARSRAALAHFGVPLPAPCALAAPRRQHMPFLLVFAVLAGAGAVIGGALAAPAIDPKNCMPQERAAAGSTDVQVAAVQPATIPEEE